MARLCVDYDGASGSQLFGDSGKKIHIAGITALNRTSVRRDQHQAFKLTCNQGCIRGVSQVFFALDCANKAPAQSWRYKPGFVSPIIFNPAVGYEVVLDARSLPLGVDIRLCVDLDGPSSTLEVGDSGLSLHVTAVSLANESASANSQGHVTVSRAIGQTIRLSCIEGCSMDSLVALVPHTASCNTVAVAMAPFLPDGDLAYAGVFGGFGNDAWKIALDASAMSAGLYRLCVDLDGPGIQYSPGDTGELVTVTVS